MLARCSGFGTDAISPRVGVLRAIVDLLSPVETR
jgi:hypothetical protein